MRPQPFEYRSRVADAELAALLAAGGAVLVEGPRACGKTATARNAAHSEVSLETNLQARRAGLLDAAILLDGDRPRLIDEWQFVPEVWNQVRRAVDDSGGQAGSFILTGSAVPADDATRHSGAGRILRLRMRPMSLAEAGYSSGDVSLARLFAGDQARAQESRLSVLDVADLVSVGGWPGLQNRSVDDGLAALRGYLADTAAVDLRRVDGVRREPQRVRRVMQSLARYTATQVSARSVAADVGGSNDPIKVHTVLDYIDALSRVFVVEDLPAWAPALRSRSRLRETPSDTSSTPRSRLPRSAPARNGSCATSTPLVCCSSRWWSVTSGSTRRRWMPTSFTTTTTLGWRLTPSFSAATAGGEPLRSSWGCQRSMKPPRPCSAWRPASMLIGTGLRPSWPWLPAGATAIGGRTACQSSRSRPSRPEQRGGRRIVVVPDQKGRGSSSSRQGGTRVRLTELTCLRSLRRLVA
jgi:AAA domain